MNHRGLLVVVSGFSGVGKGTLVKKLVTECDNYALSVSMTTRKPREGEIDGVSYFFVDHDAFEQTIAQDGLVEYASYVAIIMARRRHGSKSSATAARTLCSKSKCRAH